VKTEQQGNGTKDITFWRRGSALPHRWIYGKETKQGFRVKLTRDENTVVGNEKTGRWSGGDTSLRFSHVNTPETKRANRQASMYEGIGRRKKKDGERTALLDDETPGRGLEKQTTAKVKEKKKGRKNW